MDDALGSHWRKNESGAREEDAEAERVANNRTKAGKACLLSEG